MILKMRARQFSSRGPREGWRYVDKIAEAYNYGQFTTAGDTPDEPGVILFSTAQELLTEVEKMWGPLDIHDFWRVYFPEFDDGPSGTPYAPCSATVVRLDHEDNRVSLAILMADAFLLGDDGKTIDRLR